MCHSSTAVTASNATTLADFATPQDDSRERKVSLVVSLACREVHSLCFYFMFPSSSSRVAGLSSCVTEKQAGEGAKFDIVGTVDGFSSVQFSSAWFSWARLDSVVFG